MATKKNASEEVQEMLEETVEAPAENTVEAPPAQQEGLDIQDLQTAAQIISICTARGAFKAEEMEQVGKLFNKLNNFLTKAQEVAAAQAAQQG
jgi:hypothetical protein